MIQFLPETKKLINKLFKYIRNRFIGEKDQDFKTIINFLMVTIFIKFVLSGR